VIEKNEIKTKQNENKISETKLQDELIILKAKEMEPVTKTEFIPTNSEETSVEVKAPIEAIVESEFLPTKKEVPFDMEPPPVIVPEVTVPEPYKLDIEKIKIEEEVEEIVQKEIGIPKDKNAVVEDLIKNKLAVSLETNNKTVNSINETETLVEPKIEKEEQKVINHIERNEKEEKDVPIEAKIEESIVENEKANEVLPVTKIEEKEFVEQIVENSREIFQPNETKMTDIKETIPHMEIIRTNEILEVPPVSEMEDVEKTTPAVDVKEIEEIIPEAISPTVDITEVEKVEPNKFPIVDEKVPIANAVEEKIEIEEPTPILDVKEESLLLDAVMEEKIETEKPVLIKEEIEVVESLPIAEIAKKEKNEVTELLPIEDIEEKEKIEAMQLPISDVAKEEKIEAEQIEKKIEAEEPLPLVDVVTEEKIEIIQPIPTIKKEVQEEIEAAEELMLKEIKKEKDDKIEEVTLPEKVIPFIELLEKEKKEKIPPIEKEEIVAKVSPPKKPTLKNEKEVSIEEKKPEMVQIELKIPIAEIKPTEMEMPAISLDPRLVAQPYLIIAKIKEKELLQIIPAKPPCTECYLVSKCFLL